MSAGPADDEMLDLFRSESAEQLDELEQALARLASDPRDASAIEAARRQAHNLKGAARILGFDDLETLAHGLEDVLADADDEGLARVHLDALERGLEGLERLVEAATTEDAEAQVDVDALVDEIQTTGARAAGEGEPQAQPATGEDPSGVDPLERARRHRIETVRVDPQRLDVLMRRASELSTTAQRLRTLREGLRESRETVDQLAERVRRRLPSGARARVAQGLRRDTETLREAIEDALQTVETDAARLVQLAGVIEDEVQQSRLLPMSRTFDLFARAIRDLAREQGKRVEVELEGEKVRADKRVLEELKDPLMHLVRNAVDHGIEPPEERRDAGKDPVGRVRLAARRTPDSVVVEVEDDGRGIDPDGIRPRAREEGLGSEEELARMSDEEVLDLVFRSGFTTREAVSQVSGRGIGLGTVTESAARLRGSVDLDAEPGQGTRVAIEVPVELSTANVLLVYAGRHTFGLPIEAVRRVSRLGPEDLDRGPAGAAIKVEGRRVPVGDVQTVLGLAPDREPVAGEGRPCVVLRHRGRMAGLLVDDLRGETELVVEPLSGVLRSVVSVTGASVLADGDVCVVLEPGDLVASVHDLGTPPAEHPSQEASRRLLLVEDTEVTRRQLERALETEGWEVVTAADGEEGIDRLATSDVDAVVSDILMPNVDGYELARRIRADPSLRSVPIVLVSTEDTEGVRDPEAEAADAFVAKDVFDAGELTDTLEELVA